MKIGRLIIINMMAFASITIFSFRDVLAYQNLDDRYVAQLKDVLSKKYQRSEFTDVQLEQLNRELQSFKQFKIHAQNWLNAVDRGKAEAKQAKRVVDRDIKELAEKKSSELSQHFVKEYESIQVDDKEDIGKLIKDIDKIIDMLSIQK